MVLRGTGALSCAWVIAIGIGCAGAAVTEQRGPSPEYEAPRAGPAADASSASSASAPDASPGAASSSAAPAAAPPKAPPIARALEISDAPVAAEIEPGAAHVRAGEWKKAKTALSSAVAAVEQRANLDEMLVVHALLGRAAGKLGDTKTAEAEFTKVRALWTQDDGPKRVAALGGTDAEKGRRMAVSVTAVGEAHFFFAETDRKKAEQIKVPIYGGDGSQKDVEKHVQTKFAEWAKKRRAAVQTAEESYVRVLDIQPVPPPTWVVASAERVATMKRAFIDDFAKAPMPNDWKGSGPLPIPPTPGWKNVPAQAPQDALTREEVRNHYLKALADATEPDRQAIRAAYSKCSEIATKYGIKNEASSACDKWLADNPAPAKP
jgi:hypothetical protein